MVIFQIVGRERSAMKVSLAIIGISLLIIVSLGDVSAKRNRGGKSNDHTAIINLCNQNFVGRPNQGTAVNISMLTALTCNHTLLWLFFLQNFVT